MCWSAEVSGAFACFDVVCVVFLLIQHCHHDRNQRQPQSSSPLGAVLRRTSFSTEQKQHNLTGTVPPTPTLLYARVMALVATQEFAQFIIWRRGHTQKNDPEWCSSGWDVVWALVALVAAALIPLVFVHDMPPSLLLERRRAWVTWTVTFLTGLACVGYTQVESSSLWCVYEGPHHHQVWLCASAVLDVGGWPLYIATLLGYGYAAGWGMQYAQSIPASEKWWIIQIGTWNGVLAYGIYGWSLEACSIWCWSAFCYGLYFCAKNYVCWQRLPQSNDNIHDDGDDKANQEDEQLQLRGGVTDPQLVPLMQEP